MRQLVGDVAVYAAFFLALGFEVGYAIDCYVRKVWSDMARHLLAFDGVIALVLGLSVIRMTFNPPWFPWLRTIAFCLVPVVLAQRLFIWLRYRRMQ